MLRHVWSRKVLGILYWLVNRPSFCSQRLLFFTDSKRFQYLFFSYLKHIIFSPITIGLLFSPLLQMLMAYFVNVPLATEKSTVVSSPSFQGRPFWWVQMGVEINCCHCVNVIWDPNFSTSNCQNVLVKSYCRVVAGGHKRNVSLKKSTWFSMSVAVPQGILIHS